MATVDDWMLLESVRISGVGISSTISMSKTRKIIANMKNRSENGVRALFLGSNPHSNGDVFSRSINDREFSSFASINRASTIKIEIIEANSGIYKFYFFWK